MSPHQPHSRLNNFIKAINSHQTFFLGKHPMKLVKFSVEWTPQRNPIPSPHPFMGRATEIFAPWGRTPRKGLLAQRKVTHSQSWDFSIKRPCGSSHAPFFTADLWLRLGFIADSWRHPAASFLAMAPAARARCLRALIQPGWRNPLTVVQGSYEPSPGALWEALSYQRGESLFESISPSLLRDEDRNHSTWEGPIAWGILSECPALEIILLIKEKPVSITSYPWSKSSAFSRSQGIHLYKKIRLN